MASDGPHLRRFCSKGPGLYRPRDIHRAPDRAGQAHLQVEPSQALAPGQGFRPEHLHAHALWLEGCQIWRGRLKRYPLRYLSNWVQGLHSITDHLDQGEDQLQQHHRSSRSGRRPTTVAAQITHEAQHKSRNLILLIGRACKLSTLSHLQVRLLSSAEAPRPDVA